MRNYSKYIFLVLVISCFSCKHEVKNIEFINKLSSIQNGLPSPYFNYYLYFKMDNGEILETNVDWVYKIYKDYYSKNYKDFSFYLENLINQEETVKISDVVKYQKKGYFLNVIKADKHILVMSIESIKKDYLNAQKKQSFILKTGNIESVKARTILYKMFVDGYIITFNDYGGYYIVMPTSATQSCL